MLIYSKNILGRVLLAYQPIRCAVSSQCVQNQRSSSTLSELTKTKLNYLFYCNGILKTSSIKYSSAAITPKSHDQVDSITSKIVNPLVQTEVLRNLEDEEEEELEQQREIWKVGPALRPSFNVASFVNDSKLLQEFLKMGVRLHKWDYKPREVLEHILKMDFDKDVAPYIRFLCDHGLPPNRLDYHFTESPMILTQDLDHLATRIDYLKSKSFTTLQIASIIDTNPHWLLFPTIEIDQRLGLFQTRFKLSGNEIRLLAFKGAKIITMKHSKLIESTFKIKEEMGFEPHEIKSLLLSHPAIWKIRPDTLWKRFDYLHNTVNYSHEYIVQSPKLLMTREGKLRARIGYLQSLARAQFDPEKPNFVSPEKIINEDDAHFAVNVAKSSVIHFNEYLKTL